MTWEVVSREEILDALEEAAKINLDMYRSLVEGETVDGVIEDDDGSKAMVEEWHSDLRRWYSVLVRSGRDIGDIPELGTIEP